MENIFYRGIRRLAPVLGVVLLLACTNDDPPDRTISGNHYSNSSVGLEMQFPATWQIRADQKIGNNTFDIIASSPPVGGVTPNVNVQIHSQAGSGTVAEILPGLRGQLEAAFPDLSAYDDSLYEVNGVQVARADYESSFSGSPLHFLSVFFRNRGNDAVLTFTDAAGHFAANADMASILSSMAINP